MRYLVTRITSVLYRAEVQFMDTGAAQEFYHILEKTPETTNLVNSGFKIIFDCRQKAFAEKLLQKFEQDWVVKHKSHEVMK